MKDAGFSRYLIADIMPDDIVPDVEEELERQDKDAEALLPDITSMGFNSQPDVSKGGDPNLNDGGQVNDKKLPKGGRIKEDVE
jgi:hypothetical protein